MEDMKNNILHSNNMLDNMNKVVAQLQNHSKLTNGLRSDIKWMLE